MPTETPVSLIMSIHNEEDYLSESLKKMENQFFESIFVSDRCADNSENNIMQWFPNTKSMKKEFRKLKRSFEASRCNIICTGDAGTAALNTRHLIDKLQNDKAEFARILLAHRIMLFVNHLHRWCQKKIGFVPTRVNSVSWSHLLTDAQDGDKLNEKSY